VTSAGQRLVAENRLRAQSQIGWNTIPTSPSSTRAMHRGDLLGARGFLVPLASRKL
jgi:hypothetical protein